jgi:hypothetical protein
MLSLKHLSQSTSRGPHEICNFGLYNGVHLVYSLFNTTLGVFHMKVRRKSSLTGVVREMDIDVTDGQLALWYAGMLIQDAMPDLTPDEREFFLTGVTAEEWVNSMGKEE